MVELRYSSPLAAHYRSQGGAWDVPSLDALVSESPSRGDSLVDGDIRLTSRDVDDLTACLAGGLRNAGVGHGDVVAWQLLNGYEAVLLFRACWRLGAVAAPIDPQLDATDAAHALEQLDPAIIVGATHLALGHHPQAYVVGGPSLPARRPHGASESDANGERSNAGEGYGGEDHQLLHPHGTGRWFAKLLGAEPVPANDAILPAEVALVLMTSTSTSGLKATLHTHETLGYKSRLLVAAHELVQSDTVLMSNSLSNISGLLNGLLVPAVAGMKTVLMAKWNASMALGRIEHERVTFMVGSRALLAGLMDDPDFSAHRVRSLRLISLEGRDVTPTFVDRAEGTLDALVKRSYGCVEVPIVATSWPGDDASHVRDTDGRACGEVELRVVDSATGSDMPADNEGELWVRGPEMFVGYASEEMTHEAITLDGWFRTRDLAAIDTDGWITITGRLA